MLSSAAARLNVMLLCGSLRRRSASVRRRYKSCMRRSCQFLRGLAEASAARVPQRCTATHRLCIHVRVRYLRHADAEQFHERAREQEADVL